MWKKIAIIILIIAMCLVFLILTLPKNHQLQDFSLIATPTPVKVPSTPFRKLFVTEINKTTQQIVEALPNRLQREQLSDGTLLYTFTSPITSRPQEIRLNNNVVTYERLVLPDTALFEGYSIAYYKKTHGNPDREIQGSKFYEWIGTTYIYAKEGFAFIGNPHTDEIYEFHQFIPMAVDDYLRLYGQDIAPGASPIIETFDARENTIFALTEKLPHYGQNFTFTYDRSTNSMTVFFEQQTRQRGEEEFDTFLKQNGIESRNWLTNLQITSL
jgi:hypothetical protein